MNNFIIRFCKSNVQKNILDNFLIFNLMYVWVSSATNQYNKQHNETNANLIDGTLYSPNRKIQVVQCKYSHKLLFHNPPQKNF